MGVTIPPLSAETKRDACEQRLQKETRTNTVSFPLRLASTVSRQDQGSDLKKDTLAQSATIPPTDTLEGRPNANPVRQVSHPT